VKNKLNILLILLIPTFLIVSYFTVVRTATDMHPNYSSFSAQEQGTSLLFDTLRHMLYPVSVLYQPVHSNIDINAAILIIQPSNPRPNETELTEILNWVRLGGRLIFLESNRPNLIDEELQHLSHRLVSTMRWYNLGLGEIFTGEADFITNASLMDDSFYGEAIATILELWNPEQIYFAEYYHGYHGNESLFRQLPLWVRLATFQTIILAIVALLHLGKRFGNPIPMHELTDREENEQILVLARLYRRADKKSKH